MDAKKVDDNKNRKEDAKSLPVHSSNGSGSLSSLKQFITGGSATAPIKGKDGGSSEGSSSHSKQSVKVHLMDEFRKAIGDNQRAEKLIAQAANHPIEEWRKVVLWASASGQIGFLSRLLQRAPPDLKGLLQSALDADKFTALHRAVVAGQVKIVELVTAPGHVDSSEIFEMLHARTPEGWTALHLAVVAGDENMVTALMNSYDKIKDTLPKMTDWDFADNYWMTPLHYAVLGKFQSIVELFVGWETFKPYLNATDYFKRTAVHMAASHEGAPIDAFVENRDVDMNAVDCCLYTPLHWAVYVGATETVRCIIAQASNRTIRTSENDIDGWPVLEIAIQYETSHRKTGKDIQRLLLTSPEVQDNVERLYRDRSVYVDATNAILLGAALISTVSFSGFLTPPTGDDTTTVDKRELRVFWACNCLSFFFSMATVMSGAGAVLPLEDVYIGKAVGKIRRGLAVTSFLLISSVVFILFSFAAMGFANLASYHHLLQSNMIITTSLGAALCTVVLAWFLTKLYGVAPPDWRQFLDSVTGMIRPAKIQSKQGNLDDVQTQLNDSATRLEKKLKKKHSLVLPELKNITMKSVVFDLERASKPEMNGRQSKTEMNGRQQAKDLMGIVGNQPTWELDVSNTVHERRITPFQEIYRKARFKESETGEVQNPTLNMLILNNVGPCGIHHWVDPFPSSFCRPHCLKIDEKRLKRIQDRVLAHKKQLEEENQNFESGQLAYEDWVPSLKPAESNASMASNPSIASSVSI